MPAQASDRRVEVWHGNFADHDGVPKTTRLDNNRQCGNDARIGNFGSHVFVVRSSILAAVHWCGVDGGSWESAHHEAYRRGRAKHEFRQMPSHFRLPLPGATLRPAWSCASSERRRRYYSFDCAGKGCAVRSLNHSCPLWGKAAPSAMSAIGA